MVGVSLPPPFPTQADFKASVVDPDSAPATPAGEISLGVSAGDLLALGWFDYNALVQEMQAPPFVFHRPRDAPGLTQQQQQQQQQQVLESRPPEPALTGSFLNPYECSGPLSQNLHQGKTDKVR